MTLPAALPPASMASGEGWLLRAPRVVVLTVPVRLVRVWEKALASLLVKAATLPSLLRSRLDSLRTSLPVSGLNSLSNVECPIMWS